MWWQKKKIDAVIEAVRYAPDGRIAQVRMFKRMGSLFSDHVLVDRAALLDMLEAGRRVALGRRKLYQAGTFEAGAEVALYPAANGECYIACAPQTERDLLEGAPLF